MSIRAIIRGVPAILGAMLATAAIADFSLQDAVSPPPEPAPAVEQAAAEPDNKALQALVIDVEGPVTWRTDDASPWQPCKLNDLLDVGAEIRTGLRARVALRVGKNSTILMDPVTTIVLPEMIEEGQTLRTRVALKHGRADFKVDKVGLDNDFQVQMGSTTMAVKGTGGTFSYGGYSGPQFAGANFNEINAIEISYFANIQKVAISGAGRSSESNQNPVLAALASTVGPPPSGATAETGLSGDSAGDLGNFVGADINQQISVVSGVQQSGVSDFGAGGMVIAGTPPFSGGGNSAGGGSAGGGTATGDRTPNFSGSGSINNRGSAKGLRP